MPGGWDQNTPVLLEQEVLDPDFVALVNQWADNARAQGAQVFYRFSPHECRRGNGGPGRLL